MAAALRAIRPIIDLKRILHTNGLDLKQYQTSSPAGPSYSRDVGRTRDTRGHGGP